MQKEYKERKALNELWGKLKNGGNVEDLINNGDIDETNIMYVDKLKAHLPIKERTKTPKIVYDGVS